jgi:hypothetical protein
MTDRLQAIQERLDKATHFATLEIGPDSYSPDWKFTCTAPIGAECWLGCEYEDCSDPDSGYPEHEHTDQGECLVVLWLNEDDATAECLRESFTAWKGEVDTKWEFNQQTYSFQPLTSREDIPYLLAEIERLKQEVGE